MRSGSMRQSVSVFVNNNIKNAIGGITEERKLVTKFPCKAKRIKGEQVEDSQNRKKVSYEFTTRYSPTIVNLSAEAYIVFNGVEYEIDDIDDLHERHITLVITATRK